MAREEMGATFTSAADPVSPGRARQLQETANSQPTTPQVTPTTPQVTPTTPQATSAPAAPETALTVVGAPVLGQDGFYWTEMSNGSWVKGIQGPATQSNASSYGATQVITDALNAAGLGSLAANAWNMYKQGADIHQIMDDPTNGIRNSAAYKARFPAMAALNAQGRGISEAEYMAKESADRELIQAYGLPANLYQTPAALGKLIAGGVSTTELQSRLQAWSQDFGAKADPAIAQYMRDHYGVTAGDQLAGWMDPATALPDIQARSQAGLIGGVAQEYGGMDLASSQAQALAQQGVTDAQARQGFGQIGQEGQFTQNLPGDETGSLTQQQLVDATFGANPNSVLAYNRLRAARLAQFQAGGQAAANNQGVSGLGVANTY